MGKCYNFMPSTREPLGPASYRFSPQDSININAWTNISGTVTVINAGRNVQLKGAFQLVSQIVAVAGTILY